MPVKYKTGKGRFFGASESNSERRDAKEGARFSPIFQFPSGGALSQLFYVSVSTCDVMPLNWASKTTHTQIKLRFLYFRVAWGLFYIYIFHGCIWSFVRLCMKRLFSASVE